MSDDQDFLALAAMEYLIEQTRWISLKQSPNIEVNEETQEITAHIPEFDNGTEKFSVCLGRKPEPIKENEVDAWALHRDRYDRFDLLTSVGKHTIFIATEDIAHAYGVHGIHHFVKKSNDVQMFTSPKPPQILIDRRKLGQPITKTLFDLSSFAYFAVPKSCILQ